MKYLVILLLMLQFNSSANAQIEHPVTWSYGSKRLNRTEAVIFMKASIEKGWHIYSQNTKDGGPVKTSFTFAQGGGYNLLGKTSEPKATIHFEKSFGIVVSYFENSVVFQQKVMLKSGQVTVKGTLEYMCCNDHKCLPPSDVDFAILIK